MSAIPSHLPTIIERLLEETAGAEVCDACLAFAADAALIDTRRAVEQVLLARRAVERGPGHCESCGRETVVTAWRVPRPVTDGVSECALPPR